MGNIGQSSGITATKSILSFFYRYVGLLSVALGVKNIDIKCGRRLVLFVYNCFVPQPIVSL